MKWNEKIFRKNDIRGIYKKDFNLDFVKSLAQAFLVFYQQSKLFESNKDKKLVVAIGHDCRLSSPEIAEHLSRSLVQAGAEVWFLEWFLLHFVIFLLIFITISKLLSW